MGQVSVTINNRSYTVGCDDGQEEHIAELASYLDHHVAQLTQAVGSVGDMRLMLLAGLMVADELSETLAKLDALETELQSIREQQAGAQEQVQSFETRAVEALDNVTSRIQEIAGRLAAT